MAVPGAMRDFMKAAWDADVSAKLSSIAVLLGDEPLMLLRHSNNEQPPSPPKRQASQDRYPCRRRCVQDSSSGIWASQSSGPLFSIVCSVKFQPKWVFTVWRNPIRQLYSAPQVSCRTTRMSFSMLRVMWRMRRSGTRRKAQLSTS